MKNVAKYLGGLFLLLLAVVFISTSKSNNRIVISEDNVMSFEVGNYSNNSYAEVTSINFNTLSSIATSSRRVTRTNKMPSQPHFGENAPFCLTHQELFFQKIAKNSIILANELASKDYIYVLCCIRI